MTRSTNMQPTYSRMASICARQLPKFPGLSLRCDPGGNAFSCIVSASIPFTHSNLNLLYEAAKAMASFRSVLHGAFTTKIFSN